jgi:hypothetical protein
LIYRFSWELFAKFHGNAAARDTSLIEDRKMLWGEERRLFSPANGDEGKVLL